MAALRALKPARAPLLRLARPRCSSFCKGTGIWQRWSPRRAALVVRAGAAAGDGDDDASPSTSSSGGDGPPAAEYVRALERAFGGGGGGPLTGPELTALIRSKWGGRSFEARIQRRGTRVYLQVMWKFLEQQSFHMTRDEYDKQMAAVASVVSEWGAADIVRRGISGDRSRGPGYTVGGSARAVSIPLPVDTTGARGREWRY